MKHTNTIQRRMQVLILDSTLAPHPFAFRQCFRRKPSLCADFHSPHAPFVLSVCKSHAISHQITETYLEYRGAAVVRDSEICCQGFEDSTSLAVSVFVIRVVYVFSGLSHSAAVMTGCQKGESDDILPGTSLQVLGFIKRVSVF